ncbi:2,3-bisphosphoglycerate-dependent phosphoglycerate mutase [Pustulibacterium marinum]|uniref:2,3-bisphosphoglycerate-dependent phosphoglycerate mutase n=1 Tax=Pustulibacterium marinum TaxID=1224947 RepID=A0A1I7EU57_9FLAO|nr:2,3-bisphosphoglycerate-dependent phosphoglycerate mutase [Pustulibacterium marinum]SFU27440.1 2,3-bisphosphoglycerate-dependent phosphoglycerate mutase [Pustulibacterium marinum]
MGLLVLVRHGQSDWNKKNLFTGWVDIPLTDKGIEEAMKAGKSLASVPFDIVYTSTQIRAIETAMLLLAENTSQKTPEIVHKKGKMKEWTTIYSEKTQHEMLPVFIDWHLNERYYGELQGKNKQEMVEEFGEEQVHQWRRSFATPPPNGESLKDTSERTIPYFKNEIIPQLEHDKNILISAHGNSLRSIIMEIENIAQEDIPNLELPTGKPICYTYKSHEFSKDKIA